MRAHGGRVAVRVGAGRAGPLLGLADRPAVLGRSARQAAPVTVVGGEQQRAAVALAEVARLDGLERLVGQVEQADEVGHRHPAATDAPAHVLA